MTIGEVYNPLVTAALENDPGGHEQLRQLGQTLFEKHPDQCKSLEEGIEAAKSNLDYYCQYFSGEEAAAVKKFYKLGSGFRDLQGRKHDTA